MSYVVVKIEARREPGWDAPSSRAPCEGCDYLGQQPGGCRELRARAVALGLPDCLQGYIYVETPR